MRARDPQPPRARSVAVPGAALLASVALACAPARSAPPVPLQASLEAGQRAYKTKCASCHGLDATGGGSRAGGLSPRPSDLTRIAERNAGRFDPDAVAAHVDGREAVEQHGPRSMPVWGETGVLTESQVRDVVRYLETLQRR